MIQAGAFLNHEPKIAGKRKMKSPNNKDRILRIADKDRGKRFKKVVSAITRDYEVQPAEMDGFDVKNIIIRARRQRGKIAILAHYDIFPGSSGFNDNSTGVVTLLNLQDRLPDNVELVFTDREENSGRGCEAYLAGYPKPRIAVNVDVVGLGNRIFFEKYGNPDAIDTEGTEMESFKGVPFSDSYILNRAGVPNILLLTGPNRRELISAIFNAQHGNAGDGRIELISEDTMNRVFKTVRRIIQNNS